MALFHAALERLAARRPVLEACWARGSALALDLVEHRLLQHCGLHTGAAAYMPGVAAASSAGALHAARLQQRLRLQAQEEAACPSTDVLQERDSRSLREILTGRLTASVPVEQQRTLHAAILGVPNAGKSTLTNQLTGCKVSAVSPKTNTTSAPTLGAVTVGTAQVVLHDTPGVVDSRCTPSLLQLAACVCGVRCAARTCLRSRTGQARRHYHGPQHANRVRSAWSTARDCDLLLLVVDAHRQVVARDERVMALVRELAAGAGLGDAPPPALLLLNKIDKLEEREWAQQLAALADEFCGLHSFQRTFCLAAARRDMGVPELKEHLLSRAAPGRWLLDEAQVTDMPQWRLAEEVVREKVFLRLRQELPYALAVRTVERRSLPDGSLLLKQQILVPTETVRRMVVGARGAVVGEIGITARLELEQLFRCRVHLFIDVRLR